MKIRNNYVSNSSSASFIIYNWFDISEKKREFIMNYDHNALSVWKKNKIPFKKSNWRGELVFDDEDISLELEDKTFEQFIKFSFGYIFNDCRWNFEENKENNTCLVTTSMDNFNMERWLKYNKLDFEQLDF